MPDNPGCVPDGKVRYAVVGLGHIAQAAVLPAFKHAKQNSELVAVVSDDPEKRKKLGKKYKVAHVYSYDQYDSCLNSGEIDAVYIALPNHLHCEYAVRAAEAGIHVLCEKPMAISAEECEKMIAAAEAGECYLMIAYRLHFEEANLKAIEIARSGEIGDVRIFDSVFTMQVRDGNIRTRREFGGGTLYDLGVYCVNAARYLFRDEPIEVFAACFRSDDPRFTEVDEMSSALLRFPGDKVAMFTSSFGAADVSSYRIVGTTGDLRLEPAYDYANRLALHLTVDGRTRKHQLPKRDQFAPELLYFSQCVLDRHVPEPSGEEGLADVRILQALYQSAREHAPVAIEPLRKWQRPTREQEITRPGISMPDLVHVESPTLD